MHLAEHLAETMCDTNHIRILVGKKIDFLYYNQGLGTRLTSPASLTRPRFLKVPQPPQIAPQMVKSSEHIAVVAQPIRKEKKSSLETRGSI